MSSEAAGAAREAGGGGARVLGGAAGLAAFLALTCLAVDWALPHLPRQPQIITSLDYTSAWWERVAHQDSWMPMRTALAYLDALEAGDVEPASAGSGSEPRRLYEEILFARGIKLQYPPTSLLPIDLLRRWPGGDRSTDATLNGISWLAVPATALLSALAFALASRRLEPGRRLGLVGVESGLIALAGLSFYPLVRGYYLGQIQTWIDLLTAALLVAWLAGRPALAGAMAGLACTIKPQLGLALVWAALRGHWRFAAGQAGVVLALGLCSLAAYELANHLDYLEALAYLGRHGEGFHPNQSVNGLLNRMLGNGNNLEWEGSRFAPFHPVVYGATLASSLLLLGIALYGRRASLGPACARGAGAADLALLVVAVTLASPIAWTHHYGALLPVFAVALPLCRVAGGRLGLVVLGLSWLLVADNFRALNRLADTPWNFLQSYVLFGGLLLLGLLQRLRARLCERVRKDGVGSPE